MDTTNLDSAAPAPRSPSDPLQLLRSLGEFRLLRPLGEGGMGLVYLGYHEGQGRHVAIKVLADHLASNQSYVDRFYREAKSGSLLNHANIVKSITAGQDRATNKYYLVLEYVDGPSVRALLDRCKRLSVADAVHVAIDVARGLEHAHSRNVIHRDIKPDNILTTRSGVAKLADMGLAKRTDEASHLTVAKQGFGTPHYMPYEQAINAKGVDGRSDIYALGATLYHLVTGEVPFSGANQLEVVEKKREGLFLPPSLLNPEVPPLLDEIIVKMLAFDPRDRYQTASELIIDLERSRLASPVLSFADLDLALKDPTAQAYLASSAEPTRLDLAALPTAEDRAANPAALWHLRYRGRDGNWRKVRQTTAQIIERLRAGKMPAGLEACREHEGDFRPLADYPEFRALARRRPVRRPVRPPRGAGDVPIARPAVPPPSRRPRALLLAGAALAALAALATLLVLFLRRA